MILKLFSGFFFLLTLSCSHPSSLKPSRQGRIFPDGIYNQSVRLEIKAKEGSSFPFSTLSKIEGKNYEVLGFSPFGGKAFEAKGNLDKPEDIQLKFDIKLPVQFSPAMLKEKVATIQQIQKLSFEDLIKKDGYDFYQSKDFEIKIFKYNGDNIPSSLILETQQWKTYIQLSTYKKI